MSKKSKKQNAKNGTWALCITAGLMLGLGMTPMFGNFFISLIVCGIGGGIAGYFFTRK
jgi:hypothetical protein